MSHKNTNKQKRLKHDQKSDESLFIDQLAHLLIQQAEMQINADGFIEEKQFVS